jgi:serine/threonine protein kinase
MPELNRALWQRLSPLFDRALDLEMTARRDLLADVRLEDPGLAAALEGLLAEHQRVLASDFLETPPLDGQAPSLAGRVVGSYTLVSPLGMGGMGTVWLARRSDGRFEGSAAVKFVNLAGLDQAGHERFRREGTLLARLSHPHIARLLDAGITESGQPFLVLEYVEGTRIDRYASERRLDVAARLELFLQVADAVAHAHANLVVHRDLKPSNVLVDVDGQVKLLDFGIATLVASESTAGPTVTLGGALTPHYAAPEQVTGGPVTTATDVYALGVLLYQLLVGRHPTAPPGEAAHAVVLAALSTQDPPRPSEAARRLTTGDPAAATILQERQATPDRLRRCLRGDLDTIIGKALKKSPDERYQNVAAFADDLRRHLRSEPVTARADSVWYQLRKFAVRHRLEMGAAAGVMLALVAGTAIAVAQARTSARERDWALEQLRRAEATNDFSSFLLAQATPRGKPISNAELLAAGEGLIATRFKDDPRLRVHLLLTLADRYLEHQQFKDWGRVLKRAYDDSRTLADVGLRTHATCDWALHVAEQGNPKQALGLISDALRALPASRDHAEFESRCLLRESSAARMAGDGARSLAAAERAVSVEQRRGGAPGRELEPLGALALAYWTNQRYADADASFRRVSALLESQGLAETKTAAMHFNNWSAMLHDSGQLLAAAETGARAVRVARAADSENGASLAMLTTYGSALAAIGDHAAATAALDEALDKARAAGVPRRLIGLLSTAISAALEAGDAGRATGLLAEAERVLASDPSASPLSKGLVAVSAARAALARDEPARAVAFTQTAVQTLETATAQQTSLAPTLTFLARVLNAAGQYRDALAAGERALKLVSARQVGQSRSAPMGRALVEIAGARLGLSDQAGAREAAASALDHLIPTVGPNANVTARAQRLQRQLATGTSE